jgi:fumarate reductase flavoprotein subunit
MSVTDKREAADVVVVGASVGGLAAALLAADQGARVIVAERTRTLGGGAALEPEQVAACGSRFQRAAGVDDTVASMLADLGFAEDGPDAALAGALVRESGPLVEWLADRCGIAVTLVGGSGRGHARARVHAVGEQGGAVLAGRLAQLVAGHQRIRTRLGVDAERLTTDADARVVGVELARQRRADPAGLDGAVILACGGYAASDPVVGEHCGEAAALPALGCETATGAGLTLARAVGARTERLDALTVTPFLAVPANLAIDPLLAALGAALVDQSGRRFVDETGDAAGVARAVRARPGKLAYLLFDERTARAAARQNPHLGHVVVPKTGRRAASLSDLARQLSLDATGLDAAVAAIEASVRGGEADAFGRRFERALQSPFHAIRVTGARRRSLGGVAVDASARVLREDGTAIPGLWAVGGVIGGLARGGAADALHGMEALVALGSARLAARAFVEERRT